ncbi:calcium/calmodulin-dependent protein kinase kinase 1 isoform X1 [Aedes aegypti]|uniref:calcium/calmodulin-dependent protein kinase n=2 Tax=Aedes aegypti TaxID=7159 RepID=A0A6I8TDD7_AEDAE|nr:calcium/calmodulin-dependent protein kinase kinase 1 isoform X1 [Aedes aegypti]XP_021708748.1 calcium/calmodulin-dependent protein kinase kinase 1 isoform X1 [Aedes aegypti]
MATIDSASSWHGSGGSCRNQCATRIADLARHQTLEMEGTLAHSIIPTVDSTTTEADRKCGSLDVDLDRKFLNNNNTTSMKCLQFTRPPDPPPPPALLFDYVVEQSIQSQQHNLLDSEIKSFENISFNSNSDKQSANSQVDAVATNSPSVNSQPVDKSTVVDPGEAKMPKTDLVDNDDLLEASNRTESQLEINTAGVTFKGRVLPKLQPLDQTRPIYPNVPYSPYNSPYGSPRSGRRRTPLRESRRVSIEQSGSFLQLNQYKLLDQIGQGSYGLVKLAYSEEDSTHYAMKILSKRKLLRKAGLMRRGPKRGTSPLDRVYREIAVLKKLDHPNVVKLVEVLDDPLEDSLYLVFELVQHGEILSIPTDCPLSEERAWNIFRDVILGVEYLHYQRIIHGDLKPANLLMSDSGSVKVADLGVCNEFLGEDAAMNNGSTAGTPAFRAPETLLPGQHVYNGKAADIWALGATLYSLVHGNVPFIATSVPGVYEKIKSDPLQFPPTSPISPELRDLIETILDKDPQLRITLPQIKEHCWVTKFGRYHLPTEEENCRLVQINDEDMTTVVKSIPKLDTLILIKTMLKKHSFLNPFMRGISGRAPQLGGSRIERFSRSGRSNSAPGDYHTSERQPSNESLLPSVTEGVSSPGSSPEQLSPCKVPSIVSTPSQDSSNTATATETDLVEEPKPESADHMTLPNRAYLEVLL